MREATREGSPPIDLIDGGQLAEKLKELGLGLKIKLVRIVLKRFKVMKTVQHCKKQDLSGISGRACFGLCVAAKLF